MKSHGEDENGYVDGSASTVRADVLHEANRLLHNDRQATYGPPDVNFERIAIGWSVLLGTKVRPDQVAVCMAWLKLCRLVNSADDWDGYVDGSAYVALAAELAKAKRKVKDDA